jgi:hypothetical protein
MDMRFVQVVYFPSKKRKRQTEIEKDTDRHTETEYAESLDLEADKPNGRVEIREDQQQRKRASDAEDKGVVDVAGIRERLEALQASV